MAEVYPHSSQLTSISSSTASWRGEALAGRTRCDEIIQRETRASCTPIGDWAPWPLPAEKEQLKMPENEILERFGFIDFLHQYPSNHVAK